MAWKNKAEKLRLHTLTCCWKIGAVNCSPNNKLSSLHNQQISQINQNSQINLANRIDQTKQTNQTSQIKQINLTNQIYQNHIVPQNYRPSSEKINSVIK